MPVILPLIRSGRQAARTEADEKAMNDVKELIRGFNLLIRCVGCRRRLLFSGISPCERSCAYWDVSVSD